MSLLNVKLWRQNENVKACVLLSACWYFWLSGRRRLKVGYSHKKLFVEQKLLLRRRGLVPASAPASSTTLITRTSLGRKLARLRSVSTTQRV